MNAGEVSNAYTLVAQQDTDAEGPGSCEANGCFELTGVEFDIPEDAYGAAILAIVQFDLSDSTFALTVYRRVFGLGLLALNLFLQFAILLYVNNFVVLKAVAEVQKQYYQYRAEVFDAEGIFREDVWSDYSGQADMCQIGMTNRWFYYSVLACWSLSVMIEIRTSEKLTRDILRMPLCATTKEQILEHNEQQYIVALTRPTRFMIFLLVCVPKFVISVALLFLGCNWLSATSDFESLVMNTVAMNFVLGIDEMLFMAVLPAEHRKQVEEINFFARGPPQEAADAAKEREVTYHVSLTYLVSACIFVYVYAEFIQDVLPTEVRHIKPHCENFLTTAFKPVCDGWAVWSAGGTVLEDCYPVGR